MSSIIDLCKRDLVLECQLIFQFINWFLFNFLIADWEYIVALMQAPHVQETPQWQHVEPTD